MQKNGYSVTIPEAMQALPDQHGIADRYYVMLNETVYKIRLGNNTRQAVLVYFTIDGKKINIDGKENVGLHIEPGQDFDFETPTSNGGKFTFLDASSGEAVSVGADETPKDKRGVISVRFLPIIDEEKGHFPQPINLKFIQPPQPAESAPTGNTIADRSRRLQEQIGASNCFGDDVLRGSPLKGGGGGGYFKGGDFSHARQILGNFFENTPKPTPAPTPAIQPAPAQAAPSQPNSGIAQTHNPGITALTGQSTKEYDVGSRVRVDRFNATDIEIMLVLPKQTSELPALPDSRENHVDLTTLKKLGDEQDRRQRGDDAGRA